MALIFFSVLSQAKVQVVVRSLKDATHLEFSGLGEWRYQIRRQNEKDSNHVFVQFVGVKAGEIKSVANLQDSRISHVDLKEGVNGDALAEFTLTDPKISLFDYQTDSPTNLIFDIFNESSPPRMAQRKGKGVNEKQDYLRTLVKRSQKPKRASRGVASVDAPELGRQPPLLSSNGSDESLRLKYGIFDGGDQELKRFSIEEKDISEAALIKSRQNIYLNFPELITSKLPRVEDIAATTMNFEVAKLNNDENQMVRLLIKLLKEDKMAVALRTLKFFREKYPTSVYNETVDNIEAATYFKLWLRDRNGVDFESALARYKELLAKYPNQPGRFRIVMLMGLAYLEVGSHLGALTAFQDGARNYSDSPFYWQMRVAAAESLRQLNKVQDSIKEFENIENDLASGNFGVEARFRRGDVYFRAKDYPAAIKEYKEALARYPTKWADGANIYFNSAEAQFRIKNYKGALEEFRSFLQRFPTHPYGGYAMTRIGTILEILGAPEHKVSGAFLESYFRYRGSPGAYLAKLKINLSRFPIMKKKELLAVIKETYDEMPVEKIENLEDYVKINLADGYFERKDFDTSLELLIKYYQDNPLSPYLSPAKNRIVQNITSQIEFYSDQQNYVKALEVFIKHTDTWLAKNDRVDTFYFSGKSYEGLNVLDEASQLYRKCLNDYYASTPERLKQRGILEKLPSPDTLNLRLAKVAYQMDDVKKAGEYLNNVKDVNHLQEKEKVERSLIIAGVAEKEERLDVAVMALKNLTEHWSGQPALLAEPWLRLARILNDQKKYDQALSWIQKVIDGAADTKVNSTDIIKPQIVREALELAGRLYLNTGHPREAIATYNSLLNKYSDGFPTSSVRYKLGKIYFDQNNIKEASKVWARLKTEDDGALWAKMADENLAQSQWSDKYKQYVDRQPASQSAGGKKK